MLPAAILAVIVKAQGVGATNAQLGTVQTNLRKTEAAGTAAGASMVATGKKMQKSGTVMAKAGRKMTRRVTLPLLALTAVSGKMAMDFSQSMTLIETQAGAPQGEIRKLRGEILALAKASEFSPQELAEGLFRIESQGFRGAKAMEALNVSTELAAVGQANLEQTTIALTAATKSGIEGTEDMTITAARLNAAVGQSSMRLEDLVGALATGILPSAKTAGLALIDVTSAIALMTRLGMPATRSATRLRMTLSMMTAPTDAAAKALKKIGLGKTDLAREMRQPDGLLRALEVLKEHLGSLSKIQQGQVISAIFGGGRTSAAVQVLLNDLGQLNDIYKETKRNAGDFSKSVRKQAEVDKAKLKTAWTAIQATMVEVGNSILPVVVPALEKLAWTVMNVVKAFEAFPAPTQQAILYAIAFGVALGPVLWIIGSFVKVIGWLIATGGALKAFFVGQVIATKAATVAYAEYTAAVAAATAAQRAAIVSGGVAFPAMVPLAGTQAAKASATGFMGAFARFLPIAAAAVGIGTILHSAIGGDMKAVGYKAGGALVGGLLGFLGGPAGAAIGAGLGAVIGGALENLLSKDSFTAFQENIVRSAKRIEAALGRQKTAFESLGTAQTRLSNIGKRQKRVSEGIKGAEDHLANARKHHKAGAPQVRVAEMKLHTWKGRNLRLTRRQYRAERLHGLARKAAKIAARASAVSQKERIGLLQEEARKARLKWEADEKAGAGLDQLNQDQRRWNRAIKEGKGERKKYRDNLREVSERIGPGFARFLRKSSAGLLRTGRGLAQATGSMKQMGSSLVPITSLMKQFGTKGKRATKKVSKGYEDIKGVLGPFQTETRRQLGRATSSVTSWRKASITGIAKVEDEFGDFAGALGFKGAKFNVLSKGKKSGRQQGGAVVPPGGMKVPGTGAGDKVRLEADVEPNELIYVLNRTASKDRKKLATLENINRSTPRRQSGGKLQEGGKFVDPIGPGHGIVNRAVAGVVGDWSRRYNAAINYGYDPGGGHLSPGHNITGTATDTSPAGGWSSQPTSLFEKGLRAVVGKVGQVLYGTAGIGTSYPGHGRGEHAHIEWGMHPDIQGSLGGAIERMMMLGPEGLLKQTGQTILDQSVTMANRKLQQLGAVGGGGDLGSFGTEGVLGKTELKNLWRKVNPGTGDPNLMAAIALAESGGRPDVTNAIGARGLWQIIPSTADAFDLDYNRLTDSTYNAFGAGKIFKGQGLKAWEAFTTGAHTQFLQLGGTLGGLKKGGKGGFAKSLKKALKNVSKKPRAGARMVQKLNRKLSKGFGFKPTSDIVEALAKSTTDVEKYDEWAGNASALSITDEEGNYTPGMFKGKEEGEWLHKKLTSLGSLRNQILKAHQIVDNRKLPKLMKLIRNARKRLRKIKRAIRKGEQAKKRIEQKIKDLEKASRKKVRQLEKERKGLERQLNKAQGAKKPNRSYIAKLHAEIKDKNFAISHTGQGAVEAVRKERGQLRRVNKNQAARKRVEGALSGTIIPTLDEKRSDLYRTKEELYGQGGQIGNKTFAGLSTVQGTVGNYNRVAWEPPIGELGGEVFSTQLRLREIGEEAERRVTKPPISDTAEEQLALQKELNVTLKKENLTLKYQFGTLKNFPSVQETAAVPFAGAMAKGGVMAAEVGEKGREIVFAPEGTRVIPRHEADAALRSGGGTTVIIDQLIIHEDGTATVRMEQGDESAAFVRSVTREQSRKAITLTPGGTRGGR